jgi:DNA replication protein DnaC
MKVLAPASKMSTQMPVCPVCKCEVGGGVHGWVKDYAKSRGSKYYGFDLVPCPACSPEAEECRHRQSVENMLSKLFESEGIDMQARTWSFATYPKDADQGAKRHVEEFVARHLAGDEMLKRGLYLGGLPGRCKTSLAISALRKVIEAGESALFVMVLDLLKRLKATYRDDTDVSEDDILQAVTQVRWLVLDDLAVERPSDYVIEQLYYVIEKRKRAGLYTIVTSNLSTRELEKHWRPTGLAEGSFHAGMRVADRLREYCEGIAVQGRNLRTREK